MNAGRRIVTVALALAGLALLALGGCAPKRVLRDGSVVGEPQAPPRPDAPPPVVGDLGARVVALAHGQVGTPYAFGGRAPDQGFDCSGLVQWAFGACGVALPRSVDEQARAGRAVDAADARPGDLVFFSIHGRDRLDHVGIYAEGRRFLHAPKTGDVVRSESLDDGWWRRRWKLTRRVAGPAD